ncbi:unnamed protein product [Cylindrotheca closterium]|uniref:Uncharacterized protein n=1 Tax=Cylindrotheca closterium TaxID=2856 RepID=A0AAD2G5A1_9STRA|nr:unnamed protein product [Cylindrotheca closterium]
MAAFHGCISLLEIAIPPSVTMIEDYACQDCWSLTQVHFAEDGLLTVIGMKAFFGCESLSEVNIPSSVETIGESAFTGCQSLARVVLQEGLKTIDSGAFMECVKLEQVDIPRTLEVLGSSAFYRCTSLQEVNIEEGSLREIGGQAFQGCLKLQTVRIPSTVERLESETFTSCESLRVMQFQSGLKYVGHEAFYLCKNLQSVALPESVDFISDSAFYECFKLVSVELDDRPRMVMIFDHAFEGCESLINICLEPSPSVPASTRIRNTSFQNCTSLQDQYGAETGILHGLLRRFDGFPIHKKCYHASGTTADELAQEIESSVRHHLVLDPFDMTPFHVLLSAANCRLDLLQILLDAYPPHVLGWKDVNGKTPIEYVIRRSSNRLSNDSRNMLRLALQGWLVGSISSWNGLEAWKVDMSICVYAILAEDEVEERQSLLQEASMVLSRYERMEATTRLELSLWKMELKSVDDQVSAKNAARTIVDKEVYRIRSGASVVIPNVITFLYETNPT